MAKISWSVNVKLNNAPAIAASAVVETAEATDRIEVDIVAGDEDKEVDIQPGAAAAIQLLVIMSNRYGAELGFKASDGGSDSPEVILDGPQIFTGGSVGLFGLTPLKLKLTNRSRDQDAHVEIFVARDATPPYEA